MGLMEMQGCPRQWMRWHCTLCLSDWVFLGAISLVVPPALRSEEVIVPSLARPSDWSRQSEMRSHYLSSKEYLKRTSKGLAI